MDNIKLKESLTQKELIQLVNKLNNIEQWGLCLIEEARSAKEILNPLIHPKKPKKTGLTDEEKAYLIYTRRKRAFGG